MLSSLPMAASGLRNSWPSIAMSSSLARLAASDHRDKLVLKGGVLLAAFLVRRPTRDVDPQAQVVLNDLECVLDIVRGIAAGEPVGGIDDGLVFGAAQATAARQLPSGIARAHPRARPLAPVTATSPCQQ